MAPHSAKRPPHPGNTKYALRKKVFVRLPKRLALPLLLASIWGLPAHAADISWSGASGSNWSTAGNWIGGAAPGSTDTAVLNGTGSIRIADQSVTLNAFSLATSLADTTRLTISGGGRLTVALGVIGATGGSGSVVVSGPGSMLTNTSEITIGRNGTGSLTVIDGAHLVSRRLALGTPTWEVAGGTPAGGSGSLTVSGAGTLWENTAGVDVARNESPGSTGTLTISDGATARIRSTGVYTGAGATLNFTGAGTRVEIGDPTDPNDLQATSSGWLSADGGNIQVSGGASLYTSGTYVGASGAWATTMTVTGQGTSFIGEQRIYVGGQNGSRDVDPINGNGLLTIADGATAWGGTVGVGMDPHSKGVAVVTGNGSQLWAKANTALTTPTRGNFYVGYAGDALVVVSDGGTIKADNEVRIAYDSGSGKLVIGAQEGQAAAAPGNVIAANGIVFGDGAGELVFNHTGTGLLFGSTLSGNGTLKALAGTTILSGDSSAFTGSTAVKGGELRVNGSLAGSAVTVGSGARLSGRGTVGSLSLQSGATVAPGNSPGTLTVAGNYTQAAGSTYEAEFVPGTATSDRIAVKGTAQIADGAVLRVSRYGSTAPFSLTDRYTVLTADGGVTGRYVLTGDTGISTFYALTTGTDAGSVYVAAQQVRAFTSAALTANQMTTAGALQSLAAGGALRTAIGYLPDDAQARVAFDQLSGEIHASLRGAMVEDSRFVRTAAIDRLRAASGAATAPAGASADANGLAVWSHVYGTWGKTSGNGNAASLSHDTGGFVGGADLPVFDTARAGVLLGYGHASYDSDGRSASGSSNGYTLGAYGGTQVGGVGVRLGTAYTWSDVSTHRDVVFSGLANGLSAKYDARTFQAFAEAGYRIDVGAVALEPFGGLAHVAVRTDGFTERGGVAALSSGNSNTDVNFSTLGLRGSGEFNLGGRTLTASASLAWRHAFGDTTPQASFRFLGSDAFGVSGVPIAKNAALVEAGVSTQIARNASLRLSYTGQFGSHARSQGLRGNLDFRF